MKIRSQTHAQNTRSTIDQQASTPTNKAMTEKSQKLHAHSIEENNAKNNAK
jgi:hypothetical protein